MGPVGTRVGPPAPGVFLNKLAYVGFSLVSLDVSGLDRPAVVVVC